MDNKPIILIADDDEKIVFAFKQTFKDSAEVISAANGEEAIHILTTKPPAVTFLDITMPVKDGLTVLREVSELDISAPIVIITGFGTMNTAIEAMQLGAFDYITKPLDIQHIRIIANRAMEMVRLKNEVRDLKLERDIRDKDEIIGSHASMQEIFKKIGQVSMAPNTINVLIVGESGTGKELVAKAIHRSGENSQKPYVGINCAAIPENLLESELFGHEKGAFTGAVSQHQGRFSYAGTGTIFLDEIGDMSILLQQKLLRAIEEREFNPIGSSKKIPIKARIIAATNKNLHAQMNIGKFREDLFYRLNIFSINLPPLRDRKSDIPELVNRFIKNQNKVMNKKIKIISDNALKLLLNYDYPGNVRELLNIIISACTQELGEVLTIEALPNYITSGNNSVEGSIPIKSLNMKESRNHILSQFEDKFVKHLLKHSKGNVTHAAKYAGIERQSFQRLMRRYGIKSSDFSLGTGS